MPSLTTQGSIINVLWNCEVNLSTLQIAKFSEICWKTCRDNLENLFNLGMVYKGRVGNNKRIYWKIDEKLERYKNEYASSKKD